MIEDRKKITIEQLKEGYLITDEENERYAVVNLMTWLKDFLQLPEELLTKKK